MIVSGSAAGHLMPQTSALQGACWPGLVCASGPVRTGLDW